MSLMEGYTSDEILERIKKLDDLLTIDFGNDREAKATALCFLLGRTLHGSKIGLDMAGA